MTDQGKEAAKEVKKLYKGKNDGPATFGKGPSDIMQMQMNIKNNANNLNKYVDDLESWAKDVKVKDGDAKKRDPMSKVSTYLH